VTGDKHVQNGFEYTIAKIGRGWAEASGPVAFNLKDSQTHFAKLRMT
jgi:hypothetical protein